MVSKKEWVYELIQKSADELGINEISTKYLSEKLGMQRTNVSTLLTALVE